MIIYTGPIFDAHIHTEFTAEGSLQELHTLRSRFNILAAMTDSHQPACSGEILQELRIGRCAVIAHPDWDSQSLEYGLKNGVFSAIKINLAFMHVYANDLRLQPLYILARQFDVPVLFHTGDTGCHRSKLKYAQPLTLDEVIVDHPHIKFLLVHSGNPWFADAAVLAAKNNNVWLEISSLIEGPLNLMPNASMSRLLADPIRWMLDYTGKPEKLVFGSGWPSVDYPHYLAACASAITPDYHQQVFFENATQLFKGLLR